MGAGSQAGGGLEPARGPTLVRAMGRWTLAALVVNAVVGSGIFGLPSVLARLLGPLAPWAWLVGAAGNGVVMLCFAEVASRFSEAGGAYLYARESLPRLVAIQVGWLVFVTRVTAAAAGANLFTVNLAELLPAAEREPIRLALLTLLIGGLAAVNLRGVRQGARLSNVFTVGKLVPLAVFIAAGAYFIASREAGPAPAAARAAGSADWLRAVLLVAFAYGGYDGTMLAMGEARQPRRDAPFAMIAAMLLLAALYTAVQLVVDACLADPGASARPLVAAARIFLGPSGGALLAAGAMVSVIGYLVANFLAAPRLLFALSANRDLPLLFGRIHPRFRTPHLSILTFGVLVWALAAYGNFQGNATLSAVSRLFVYASTCVALIVLRRRRPGEAWLRLPGGTALAALGIGFCALLASRMGAGELAVLLVVAVVGLIHWSIAARRPSPCPCVMLPRQEEAMLDHVSLGTNDLDRARSFYDTVLGGLGYRRLMSSEHGAGWGTDFPSFWVNRPLDRGAAAAGNGSHVALRARSRAEVDEFHRVALAAGAADDGPPGPRPYHPTYYSAFVRDPDGNKIEIVHHGP